MVLHTVVDIGRLLSARHFVSRQTLDNSAEIGQTRSFKFNRVVDVIAELFKFSLLLRGRADYLLDRYRKRNEHTHKAINRQIET